MTSGLGSCHRPAQAPDEGTTLHPSHTRSLPLLVQVGDMGLFSPSRGEYWAFSFCSEAAGGRYMEVVLMSLLIVLLKVLISQPSSFLESEVLQSTAPYAMYRRKTGAPSPPRPATVALHTHIGSYMPSAPCITIFPSHTGDMWASHTSITSVVTTRWCARRHRFTRRQEELYFSQWL